mgnify:FL=1
MVASVPKRGAKPEICIATAARTCWLESVDRSLTQGRIRARMTSRSTSFAKPGCELGAHTGFHVMRHTWDLSCGSSSNLGLVVFQQVDERANKLVPDDALSDSFGQSNELVGDHVSDPPRLVRHGSSKSLQKMSLDLCLGQVLGDSDEVGDSEQSDGVLVVRGELAVQGDDFVDDEFVVISDSGNGFGKGLRRQHESCTSTKSREGQGQLDAGQSYSLREPWRPHVGPWACRRVQE